MAHEDGTGIRRIALVFDGVEAYKTTYYHARGPETLEAYDRLVSLGATSWLAEISACLERYGDSLAGLEHLMIDFDDGPCYEMICRGHHLERSAAVAPGLE